MEVLVAILALAGAVIAGITTGVLIARLRDEPAGWLIAWSVATGALAVSLAAIAAGSLIGFGPVTFRAFQITGSLLAPLWLTVGTLELLAEKPSARFSGWLLGVAVTIVGAVIMILDPITSGFGKEIPDGKAHWDLWPEWLLRGVHVMVIFMLLVSLAIALLSWRDGDDYDVDNMNATVVLAPAGMALAAALELTLPGIIAVALMAATAGGTWYVVARPLAPYDDEDEDDEADDWQEERLHGPARGRAAAGRGGAAAAAATMVAPVPPLPQAPAGPPSPPSPPVPPAPRRSGLGDLVAEYRAGEPGEVDYAARMRPGDGRAAPVPPPDDFGGPMTGQMLAADAFGQGRPADYAMPAAQPEADRAMPATGTVIPGTDRAVPPAGAVIPGAELPSPMDFAASFGVGFNRGAAKPQPAGASVKPSPSIYGLLTVFTLLDGSGDAFDKLAEETVEEVLRSEPDTLLFICHGVKSAPLQRIVYELYRDEVGYAEHQHQPHMERFATERQPLVLATNVIELTVNAAKVVPLPTVRR